MVCYPLERHDLCPVTQVFIADEAQGNDLKNDAAYTVLDFDEINPQNRFLVYSKLYDSLPIVNTVFDMQPCMDPNNSTRTTPFYPLERDRGKACTESSIDPGFSEVGYSATLYDLYQENRIISSLQS